MVIGVHSQESSLLSLPISNVQQSVEIAMFSPTLKTRFINEKLLWQVGLFSASCFGVRFVFVVLMVALNLIRVQKEISYSNLSVCHWNLNSITAHNIAK